MALAKKIGIVGCGNVGATIAYTLTMRSSCTELVLIDLDEAKAQGEAMDLNHCLPFLTPVQITAGSYDDLAGAEIIVLAAGVNQKPGETRIDLVHHNARIFRGILEKITAVNRDAVFLVVTNPVDVLTYAALRMSGLPAARVIGSGTVLDTARLKFLVGRKLGVDSRNVHSFIIGEHGDSELAVWSSANVSGINLADFAPSRNSGQNMENLCTLYEDVKNSAYEIIRGKGATYYAIAQATQRIIDAILRDEDTILPVSAYLNGEYGLSGLCMSVPAVVGRSGVHQILTIPLNEEEQSRLYRSAETLKSVIDSLDLA